MVPEAAAGAPNVADHLALFDLCAHRRAEPRLVRVTRRQRARVLDAGEVPVAARGRLALHEHDLAVRGGADRRAGRDADVDARVAGLPGARLAERRRDRTVDRPDQPARARLDRAGGDRPRVARELGLDLRLLLLQRRDVVLEIVAAVARARQQAVLVGARRLDAVAAVDEPDADAGDLVALVLDLLGDLRLALLERVEPLGGRGGVGLGVGDDGHDLRVLARDALHEVGAGQQVGE